MQWDPPEDRKWSREPTQFTPGQILLAVTHSSRTSGWSPLTSHGTMVCDTFKM